MGAAPKRWWRLLTDYVGLAAEVAAWAVMGILIAGMALMLNPVLARGDPFLDRALRPKEQLSPPDRIQTTRVFKR
jgi:hypothetical protein